MAEVPEARIRVFLIPPDHAFLYTTSIHCQLISRGPNATRDASAKRRIIAPAYRFWRLNSADRRKRGRDRAVEKGGLYERFGGSDAVEK